MKKSVRERFANWFRKRGGSRFSLVGLVFVAVFLVFGLVYWLTPQPKLWQIAVMYGVVALFAVLWVVVSIRAIIRAKRKLMSVIVIAAGIVFLVSTCISVPAMVESTWREARVDELREPLTQMYESDPECTDDPVYLARQEEFFKERDLWTDCSRMSSRYRLIASVAFFVIFVCVASKQADDQDAAEAAEKENVSK